jgi:hypothetical protein
MVTHGITGQSHRREESSNGDATDQSGWIPPWCEREVRDPAAPFTGATRTCPMATSGGDEWEEGPTAGEARVSPLSHLEGAN